MDFLVRPSSTGLGILALLVGWPPGEKHQKLCVGARSTGKQCCAVLQVVCNSVRPVCHAFNGGTQFYLTEWLTKKSELPRNLLLFWLSSLFHAETWSKKAVMLLSWLLFALNAVNEELKLCPSSWIGQHFELQAANSRQVLHEDRKARLFLEAPREIRCR